ncbi:WLM domain-containing protein [Cantharellus anzutake]|uniref:WLM domain-containing protein n=1 Tax=Cantharellus anzutake TaxID=1750568 RepID=UPI0019083750|nr:WLM domain-containing protein [Cantharellus anzutake]KAF8325810.1 WLM domain-containing protein [Cantharellus anzutake]
MPGSNFGRKQQIERALTSSKDSYVLSYSHLKGRPHEGKAIPMLQKVASLVKPIMRKHGWTLPLLSEFFPDNPSLVDVNGGEQILLRLRPAWAPNTFYDEGELVSVMLHELTHNVHGPHDSAFYTFLSKLEDEYAELQRSGYSGEGFFSKGKKLGGGYSLDLPPHTARLKAVEAAEKRARVSKVLGSGGNRLGGAVTAKSPRELAAEAAERRTRDEKSCGHGQGTGGADVAKVESEKAAREDGVIDLTSSDEDDDITVLSDTPEPVKKTPPTSSGASTSSQPPQLTNTGNPRKRRLSMDRIPQEWSCAACTFNNPPINTQCEICLTPREPSEPEESSLSWTCWVCDQRGMPHEFWTCTRCGWVKVQS